MVTISCLPSELNLTNQYLFKSKIFISHFAIMTQFYYTVGGKVSLAGLSLDPPIILKVNFL